MATTEPVALSVADAAALVGMSTYQLADLAAALSADEAVAA